MIRNDGEASTDVMDVDIVEPHVSHSIILEECADLDITEEENAEENAEEDAEENGEYHTPMCGSNCSLAHHDLVMALCTSPHVNSRKVCAGELPGDLFFCIESAKSSGWDQNSDIPDPSEEFRCPLLFLACALGKIDIGKILLQKNFNPRVVNKHGETALHYTARHLWSYKVETFTKRRSKELIKKALVSFDKTVTVLTGYYPKILVMKDQSGRTALHVSAVNMSNIKHPNSSLQARGALFHLNCLKCMIRRLLTLLDASVLTKREVMEVMKSAENSNGDSVLHMLARDSAHGFALLKRVKDRLFGINGTLNFNNRENKTVLAVAWETDAQATMQMFSVFYPPRCRPGK